MSNIEFAQLRISGAITSKNPAGELTAQSEPEANAEAAPENQHKAIVVTDLHKSFGSLEVLKGVSLSASKGDVVAIIGGSGSGKSTIFRRIWLPQAIRNVLPTLGGETILQLKATPFVATITVVEIYSVSSRLRSDLFITYEPLLPLAVFYMMIASVITLLFKQYENRVLGKR